MLSHMCADNGFCNKYASVSEGLYRIPEFEGGDLVSDGMRIGVKVENVATIKLGYRRVCTASSSCTVMIRIIHELACKSAGNKYQDVASRPFVGCVEQVRSNARRVSPWTF